MAGVVPVPSPPLVTVREAARSPLRSRILPPAAPLIPRRISSSNRKIVSSTLLIPNASVGTADYTVEPGTNVDFPRELEVPGCSDLLVLLGTGFREKVFAIIGVKVYAAGLYVKRSIVEILDAWKGKSVTDIIEDSALFDAIFKAPKEKSLRIELVRDVDGGTFWNALDEAISPRVKKRTPTDESALSTFRSTFQGRDLKKGTFIYLTWVGSSEMLVSISSDGLPLNVDAQIKSVNVIWALYDAFFGNSPVSPTLKASVVEGLTMMLN